jgi:3-hydroxymyristoyl/3-hydroxydecanoyl-(acyl carrier protein) dehydratase
LVLKNMVNTKFLKPVSPKDGFLLTFEIKYESKEGDYCANCSIVAGNDVCARMKLICRQS